MGEDWTIEAVYVERLAAKVKERGLSNVEVARLVGCAPRTVIRVLRGQSRRMETLRKFAAALRVELDNMRLSTSESAAHSPKVQHSAAKSSNGDISCPVIGWRQAAQTLGIARDTLWRDRHRYGCRMSRPWWESAAHVRAWYQALTSGPRLDNEPTPAFVDEQTEVGR